MYICLTVFTQSKHIFTNYKFITSLYCADVLELLTPRRCMPK